MSKTTGRQEHKLVPFDAARYLTDDAAIAEYITAVLETDDPDLLLAALGDVARARGMAEVARDAGLGRESLYKALTPGAKPRFDTVLKVARALGVRLCARAEAAAPPGRGQIPGRAPGASAARPLRSSGRR